MSIGGLGINCAGEPFALDPELAWGEDDRFSEWSDALGRRLFPLGELDHGRCFLGIDEGSEIYLVEAWVASFGPMPRALKNLISGVIPRRIDGELRQLDQARGVCRRTGGPYAVLAGSRRRGAAGPLLRPDGMTMADAGLRVRPAGTGRP
ncbi:SUKH-3 domain-containing protein [Streptomyces niger]|uniref:SUKH-3 domain-containing protein n=1 Tax=Streptomyces niger TaxID=66373 RepID=UPI0018FECE2E